MAQYKGYVEPYTFFSKKLLKALYHKEGVAQSEVDCFLENCAKKWQTREGTCQIKRQRLKSRMSGIRLSAWWQILTWLTFKTGYMEKYIEVEENF